MLCREGRRNLAGIPAVQPLRTNTITVHDDHAKLILAAIKYVYDHKAVTETFTNENHNGNGLYEVVRQWTAQKSLL